MVQCLINSIAFGGDGVGRIDGLAIFTPFTLPREEVEIEIVKKKKNFAVANLKSVISAHPERINAPCQYFSKCGGCQLQHASYPLQLEIKRQFIQDSLQRIGKINFEVPPVIPSPNPFAYRRHISLKIKFVASCYQIGFTAANGTHLPITSCLLLEEKQPSPILNLLQKTFEVIDPSYPISESSIRLFKTGENHFLIACQLTTPLPFSVLSKIQKNLYQPSLVSGLIIKTPNEMIEEGNVNLFFTHDDLTLFYSPFGFVQNHPIQSANIYRWILEKSKDSEKTLDLYCGIGASSLSLAKKGLQVIGVEANPLSIELAKKNADLNKITGIEFICDLVESCMDKINRTFNPDTILANPPKSGISASVLSEIISSKAKKIIYTSCNPTTLARDLFLLVQAGFVLNDLQGFDMFPQTTHVEITAVLHR